LAGILGYTQAFMIQSGLGLVAFLTLLLAMPETRPAELAPAGTAAVAD
jgi:predicted MFS family arabinose efflux permease